MMSSQRKRTSEHSALIGIENPHGYSAHGEYIRIQDPIRPRAFERHIEDVGTIHICTLKQPCSVVVLERLYRRPSAIDLQRYAVAAFDA